MRTCEMNDHNNQKVCDQVEAFKGIRMGNDMHNYSVKRHK